MSIPRSQRTRFEVGTTDYHTAGEPFRIVTSGQPELPGSTVLDRRAFALEHADAVRQLLVNEPRGHADMYGGYVVPADDDGAQLGVVFFHKDGYSTACGHGTIALATWAVETGLVAAADDGETPVTIDVPSGRVSARVRCTGGAVQSATFSNVPAWVSARDLTVETSAGRVRADLSYGGAFYASVRAADPGLTVTPQDLPRLTELGREIKWALNGHEAAQHPHDDRLSGVYGVIWWEDVEADPVPGAHAHQRNVTVFADGEVDRSPCGSGTSARLALLADAGVVPVGGCLAHDSIVGSRFTGRVVGTVRNPPDAARPAAVAYLTEVEGRAHRTGSHVFVVEEGDELGLGFQLR
jgi:proline racemase